MRREVQVDEDIVDLMDFAGNRPLLQAGSDSESGRSRKLLLSFPAMVVVGLLSRVMNILQFIPMYNYPSFGMVACLALSFFSFILGTIYAKQMGT
eukprot:g65999.t1